MTPLFVDTINSLVETQHLFTDLRATQNQSLQFQATQDLKLPYNWLTQSNCYTLKDSLQTGSLSDTQSTLLFKQRVKTVAINEQMDIARLRRRFLKDNNLETNKFFARKQIEKKTKEDELKKQFKMKRSNHVEKYRQYRIGDFPDIQIKFSELIAPLQALAQRDSLIAMKLFESIFVSIVS